MPVALNSNTCATLAANNLSASSIRLQRSLNRLSSGSRIVMPSDDAGGLAVSMKLSAAARRMGAAATNIANTQSYLQTQDGALKTLGKVLDRISELKTLGLDPTKNASDLANYNTEFKTLQDEIFSVAAGKFNGRELFGSTALSVFATEDGSQATSIDPVNLFGATSPFVAPRTWTDFSGATLGANWTGSGNATTVGSSTVLNDGMMTTTQNDIKGPYSISFSYSGLTLIPQNLLTVVLWAGGNDMLSFRGLDSSGSVTMDVAADGSASWIGGGSSGTLQHFASPTGSNLFFGTANPGDRLTVESFSITGSVASSGVGHLYEVATATSLSALDMTDITGSIEDLATYRAQNGSAQSRLGYATELLTTNKTNLEQSAGRIVDVDVAEESAALARNNVLVQAGTSMLSQANQSTQLALRLIAG